MLKTVVKKGNYHDSVVLMLLTNHISTIEGVNKASIMMATPANKDIFKQSGLDTEELMEASANDMVIVADIVEESVLDTILSETEEFFKKHKDDKSVTLDRYPIEFFDITRDSFSTLLTSTGFFSSL